MKIKKTIQALIPSLIIFLQAPFGALAAPTITSVSNSSLSNGQIITISGAGFGARSTVSPVLWDTVDNQTAYSSLSNGATIPTGSGKPWGANDGMTLSTTGGRNGGKCYTATNTTAGNLQYVPVGSSPSAVYVSWWWKPSVSPIPPAGNHSSKFIRLSNEANLTNQTFSWTQMQSYVWNDPNYLADDWFNWPGVANQWNFQEVWINNVTRTYSIRVNGQTQINNSSWGSGSGFTFDYLWKLGWDGGGNAPPSITSWMDDIYVDNTLSRVMICDNANYGSVTKCEMQIPTTTWNDGQIEITVNQGGFAANSNAYLYVVDASGNVSNGQTITFGNAGVGAGGISPVGNLRATQIIP